MTKIALSSDIHLEFMKKNLYVPKFNGEDYLVLAGDIQLGLDHVVWFADLLEQRSLIYIAGNHEFYSNDFFEITKQMPRFQDQVNELAQKRGFEFKLHCLQNQTLETDDAKFIACTLWTDFNQNNPMTKWHGQRNMNDYRVIRAGDISLTPDIVYDEHVQSRDFLTEELAKPSNKKKVVITHHAPSEHSVHPQYRNAFDAPTNFMYFSNLDHLAEQADYWLHGHVHNHFDYNIGKCRVLCNPRGYNTKWDLNQSYLEDLIIDLA